MSNIGKWDEWYKKLPQNPTSFKYGDTITYKKAHEFLLDCVIVEDWGVGGGGFLRYRKNAIGVDGSNTPFATKKYIDLTNYTTVCEGIHIRHVLEHNYDWQKILINAMSSATKKICVVLFIPLSETETVKVADTTIDVPDLSISKKEFFSLINGFFPMSVITEEFATRTQYKQEIMVKIIK